MCRGDPGEAVGAIELEEHNGLTVLTQTIRYGSVAAREMVLRTPMEHGVALGYDRLANRWSPSRRKGSKENEQRYRRGAERFPKDCPQSAGALLAGFIVNVALSLGMDAALRAAVILPTLGVPMTDAQSLLATVYRTLIAIIGSYVVARLAPHQSS